MSNSFKNLAIVGVVLSCATPVFAQSLPLVAASNGVVPAGAVQIGSEADGRALFVCVAPVEGSRQVGKVGGGSAGCVIGYQGREIVVASYQVVVAATPAGTLPPATGRRGGVSVLPPVVLTPGRVDRLPPAVIATPATGITPGSVATTATKRGFEANGKPYREQKDADGSTRRSTLGGGITITKPDGSVQKMQMMMQEAPLPTPPQLPADPALGRAWVERQNNNLLDVIRALVDSNEAEMAKFTAGERASVGDDLFAQVNYRSTIALFLVQG